MNYRKMIALILGISIIMSGCGLKPSETKGVEPSPVPSPTPEATVTPDPTVMPSPSPTPEPTPEAPASYVVSNQAEIAGMVESIIGNMTLEEKVGQMFLVNFEALDKTQGSYYEHTKFTEEMKKSLVQYKVGGVIFFGRNIETIDQTKEFIQNLQEVSKVPLFIAVDEEGGTVARIGNNTNMRTTAFPSMKEVGAMEDEEYTYNMGATIGREIHELGFNLDFAPVTDVITNEGNTEIGDRSFGSDPKKVAKMVKQAVSGLMSENVIATLKHFPGSGGVEGDSHDSSTNIDASINELREINFVPFEAGIKAGAQMILVSHASLGRVTGNTIPASMNDLVLHEILRTELGFQGIIITDAMDMKAITDKYKPEEAALKAITAGVDIVLMPQDLEAAYQSVLEAIYTGKLSEEQINQSVRRILELKIRQGMILSDTPLAVIN